MPDSPTRIGIFGQSPRLYGLYTQLCFLFPLDGLDVDRQRDIEAHLCAGLERLTTSVPWLGGTVTRIPSGEYIIQSTGKAPALVTRDPKDSLPDYHAMREARFPFSMLYEKTIAPLPTLPTGDEVNPPVMMLQANFVKNGLLLVVVAQHNCMDLRGEAQCMELFAKACRDDEFSAGELAVANTTTIDLAHGVQSVPTEKPDNKTTPSELGPGGTTQSPDHSKPIWVYFLFSSTALARLKQNAELTKSVPFISTDDALSALLWQAVSRARTHRFSTTECTSTFERQVNARKHLGLSHAYMGNLVFKTQTTLCITDVVDGSLGALASHLRRSLDQEPSIETKMRNAAAKLQQSIGTTQPFSSRGTVSVTDVKLSSWAQENCCRLDFGGQLGVPEAVRRPSFEAWEGLAYFMPKGRDGEIPVALCLCENDLTRLRADETFCKFGEYVG